MTTLIDLPSSKNDASIQPARDRVSLAKLLGATSLGWSAAGGDGTDWSLVETLEAWGKTPPQTQPQRTNDIVARLEKWLPLPADTTSAIECLAWGRASQAVAAVSRDGFRALVDCLESIAIDAAVGAESPVVRQLLGVELPLTLAVCSEPSRRREQWLNLARRTWRQVLEETLTGEGTPAAEYLSLAGSLLASWTRSAWLDSRCCESSVALSDEEVCARMDVALRTLLRMRRANGDLVFSATPAAAASSATSEKKKTNASRSRAATSASPDSLFELALTQFGSTETKTVAKAIAKLFARPVSAKSRASRSKPLSQAPLSIYDGPAQMASLRTAWHSDGSHVAVAFHDGRLELEWNARSQTIFSGTWTQSILANGRSLAANGSWEQVCWYSDEEIDYLELELWLGKGWRIQRQIALAREDGLLLLADAIHGTQAAKIEYHGRLPFGPRSCFFPARETRDGAIRWDGAQPHATNGVATNGSHVPVVDPVFRGPAIPVFPLAIPEWRAGHELGEVRAHDGHLELLQVAEGRSLYAPLMFDLDPHRKRRQFTWRPLTVAEHLKILPRDTAVGYRLQIDDQQWLLYRSMSTVGNRTLLGKNLYCDFYFGRFEAEGKTETLVEIE